jgi:hypothetical protein
MARRRPQRSEWNRLESDLRALRRPPRRTFSAALAVHVREQARRGRRRPLGVALAFALTGAIVVALAAVGGLGYAASASERTATAVGQAVFPAVKATRSVARLTPAQRQYQVTICHRTTTASRPWTQLSVGVASIKKYLARGDFVVTPSTPCPPLPRASCSITSILGRRVGILCSAGRVRAGKPCLLKVQKTVVARGLVAKNGKYSTKFSVRSPLARGTRIFFLVSGKTLTSVRV